jgi:hypothetical protein
VHPTHNPLSPTPAEPTPADNTAAEPQIIAVFADDDHPAHAELFTPNGYAAWHETNRLSGAFPDPARFYGATAAGKLELLVHLVNACDYDAEDYAVVTHIWKRWSDQQDGFDTVHAVGVARRDGRA